MKILGWILKGIGMLLLGILLLLLLLVLLILFVPLRYRLTADKQSDQIHANGTVSWLFHLVHAGILFTDRKLQICLRLVGIPLFKKEIPIGAGHSGEEEKDEVPSESVESPKFSSEEPKELPAAAVEEKHEATSRKSSPDPHSEQKAATAGKSPVQDPDAKKKPETEKKGLKECVLALVERIKETYASLHERYEDAQEKLEKGKKLLFHERTQVAIRLVRRNIWRILQHIRPRRMQGWIHIGFPDSPGLMGQILVFASMLYPLYGEQVEFEPDYEEKVLDGSLNLSGRIIPVWLLLNVLQVLFSRNVRFVRAVLKKWKQEA
mgnify:CR=1 FL=1